MAFPRNLRYSPVNWLIVDWGYNGTRFSDCGLPDPPPCPPDDKERPEICLPLPIQEAIDTYTWERFLPEVMVGIDDPDEEIAANYAREAAIEFAKKARVMQRQIVIPLQPGVCTYPVLPYDEERIQGVIAASFDTAKPCPCSNGASGQLDLEYSYTFDAARNEITIQGSPKCHPKAHYLRLLVWASPTETSCQYDKFLYDNYRREITILARRNYVLAYHFRDNALLRVLPNELEFIQATLKAKSKSMQAHSWQPNPVGSGMWGGNRWRH